MLSVKLKRTELNFDITFFAVIALFGILGGKYGEYSLIAAITHELGHLIALRIRGVIPDEITFYGGGIKLKRITPDIFVLISGAAVNFLCAVLFGALGLELKNESALAFALISALTGFINLLPLKGLDGGGIIERICARLNYRAANFISEAFNALGLIIFALGLIYCFRAGMIDATAAAFFVYFLIVGRI